MKLVNRALALIALMFISVLAAAQSHAPNDVPERPDPGSVTGSKYTNKYFGFTLTIPSGWNVQDADFKKALSEKGKEIVTSDDPGKKDQIEKAVDQTLNLLTVTELPPGSAGSNALLICGAERPPGMKTDADYMLGVKTTLKYSQVPVTFERDVYYEEVGGVMFSVLDLTVNYSGVIVRQKYYAHVVRGYALFFISIYQTPQQLSTLSQMMKSVTLQ